MSRTKSKKSNKKSTANAVEAVARKNSLTRRRLGLEVGDRVRITDISPDLKDASYDLKDAEHREMRTAEIFRFCLGRAFTVYGFDRYGYVELDVSRSPAVRKKFGLNTIWMEPEFLKRVQEARKKELSCERRVKGS
jgi:hypothetical protein